MVLGASRDQEETQTGDLIGFAYQQDRADILAISFGDPATLAPVIVIAHEGRDDLSRQRFEPLVPAVLLTVERAMPADDPAHVAGTRSPQKVRDGR